MASNNGFMTDLLALLDNEDKLMKVVTCKPSSSAAPLDVKDYLTIIEEILDLATAGNHVQSKSLTLPSKEISSTITELCCQITCRAQHTNNVGETLASIFDQLSSFPWGARAVLTLLALTMHYAEKWRLTQIEESDELLRLMASLRGEARLFLEISNLIRVTLEFTRCIVENDSEDFQEFTSTLGKTLTFTTTINISDCFKYITVFVLGCSVEFTGMISAGNEFQGRDLSPFLVRVTKKQESFKKLVEVFVQTNEEKLLYKKIRNLYRSRADIAEFIAEFMALLCCNGEDPPTVTRGFEKTLAKVEQLQKKKVMLLISDLTLSDDDIFTLNSIYTFEFQTYYEIMWVPIADVKDDEQFQKKRSKMPWYSSKSVVSKAAARFIKKYWQFKQQTKVVVLNQEGEVVNKDAMTMIRLWRAEAFPFMPERGCELWDKHSSNWLKLLVETTVSQSMSQSVTYFLVRSAEDSKTVEQIDDVLKSKCDTFKFMYSNVKTKRKQFLSCLKNCISWKMQVNKGMTDSQTLQLLELYNRYKQQSGFAIVTRGSSVLVNTSLSDLCKVLSEHTQWITKKTTRDNFDTHFQEISFLSYAKNCFCISINCLCTYSPPSRCLYYLFHPIGDCGRDMEIIVTFKCCHDKH
ncbi:hypothetical protein ACJRO7_031915 [Eucalyptus globulus]|uniref:Sieve element occlusion N-terminal domain-containing protein n=1 Tax=Eucalyptus globulus TaxID=34317 RepID=A0ABD3JLF6_EUCGL